MLTLASCGAPERLSQDVNLENSKEVVKERILAPLSTDNTSSAELPTPTPRRQLLQLRYHDDSLINPSFIDTLERLSGIYAGTDNWGNGDDIGLPASLTATPVSFTETEDPFEEMKSALTEEPEAPRYEPVSDKEKTRITSLRASKRSDIVIREGLKLEQELFGMLREIDDSFETAGQELEATLFTQLKTTEDRIQELEDNRIPGVSTSPPGQVFGRNLTRDSQGYFGLPTDLALVGSGNDGAVSSKIGALRGVVDNPVVQINFVELPLADALKFITSSANLQVLMSSEIEDSPLTLSLNVEAGVLSILDAVLSQYNVSLIYDQDLEVAQFYSDTEYKARIDFVRQAVETYNTALYERREMARLKQERNLLNELIDVTRAIIYDYETETASSYSDDEIDLLITRLPKNDDTFSKPLSEKRKLEDLQSDKNRLLDMIGMVQSLLSGDAEAFFDAVDTMPRDPGGEDITEALNNLTLKRLSMAEALAKFDEETNRALADRLVVPEAKTAQVVKKKTTRQRTPISAIPGFSNLAVSDPCVYEGREVFTEKIAVYGGQNAIQRIETILSSYFEANGSSFEVTEEEDDPAGATEDGATEDGAATDEAIAEETPPPEADDEADGGSTGISTETSVDVSASDLIPEIKLPVKIEDDEPTRPAGCGDDPAGNSPNFVAATDFSGLVVSGLNSDIELFVRLVEEFDRPQRQVLVEVFMINVVKDFSRKLDLSFQTDSLAGNLADTDGFFLRRDLTALSNNVTSTSPGGFVSGLLSRNLQVQALVDFLESNDLGRSNSSPTFLVEEGSSAYVTRKNTKPVTRVTQSTSFDSNNNPIAVPLSVTEEEEVSFRLDVTDVQINPNNNNVTLDFTLTDQSFETTLANVTSETGTIEDEIKTKFVAAPGDVIVLAGLFKQTDSAEATGLPGTTTSGLPTAFLLGGEDSVGNKVEEMIILMAPTVIEPEVGKSQPNSAINRTLGSRAQQLQSP
ncbi:MAG: hypothetical protein J4F41_04990 [Alphaproteobacteria bacterium]|nr:hypothetical protein [Alphaproteobacteria bacterium]